MPKAIKDQYTGLYTPEKRYRLRHPEFTHTERYKQQKSRNNKKYRIKNYSYELERKKQYRIRRLTENV